MGNQPFRLHQNHPIQQATSCPFRTRSYCWACPGPGNTINSEELVEAFLVYPVDAVLVDRFWLLERGGGGGWGECSAERMHACY